MMSADCVKATHSCQQCQITYCSRRPSLCCPHIKYGDRCAKTFSHASFSTPVLVGTDSSA